MTDAHLEVLERARQMFSYDPITGFLKRRISCGGELSGTIIKGALSSTGYPVTRINYRIYKIHRIAFLLMTGRWPVMVDHINMIKSDNRWSNLREATRGQNMANRKRNRNNTSGFKGVSFCKRNRRWVATIAVNKKHIQIGIFDSPELAHAAYAEAAIKFHGEYARAS